MRSGNVATLILVIIYSSLSSGAPVPQGLGGLLSGGAGGVPKSGAATTARSANSSSSAAASGGSFSGEATHYTPGGPQGACQAAYPADKMFAALNRPQYGNVGAKSTWCGKCAQVSYGGKSVKVTIMDACPECKHGDVDLSQPAFQKIAPLSTGRMKITWSPC